MQRLTFFKLELANTKYTQQNPNWVTHRNMLTANLLGFDQDLSTGGPNSKQSSTVSAKSGSASSPRSSFTFAEHFN